MLFLTKHHTVMLNYKSIVCTCLCMSVNVGIRKYLCVINTYKISSWHYNIHEQEQWQQFHWTVSIIIPSMSAVAQCVVNTPCMVKSMVRRWHMGSWCPTLWGADCMGPVVVTCAWSWNVDARRSIQIHARVLHLSTRHPGQRHYLITDWFNIYFAYTIPL